VAGFLNNERARLLACVIDYQTFACVIIPVQSAYIASVQNPQPGMVRAAVNLDDNCSCIVAITINCEAEATVIVPDLVAQAADVRERPRLCMVVGIAFLLIDVNP
jgi:hypothetical protein